jgi:hypothetical protein
MQILVRVSKGPVDQELPGPFGPGKQFVFSKNLVVLRIVDNSNHVYTPGHGLPKKRKNRRVGTYSGLVTTLRVAQANDKFVVPGTELFQYESTYRFGALPNTPLHRGQITERGVVNLDSNLNTVEPKTFAITGGTEAYAKARGQVSAPNETTATSKRRLLQIQ